jgi:hypothetical protein
MQNRERVRGSDKEYYEEYLKTYMDLENTRRRVRECLN